jgi:DNA-binding XRE family transcriptional regulator
LDVKAMMSRTQLRMARAALGWTLKDLAERAKVNLNTISRYEAGGSMLSNTLEKIEADRRNGGLSRRAKVRRSPRQGLVSRPKPLR